MSYPERIHIEKHISEEELNKRIKTLEKDAEILKRLYFIKFRHDGFAVSKASKLIGITKRVGYIWQCQRRSKSAQFLAV